MSAVASAHWPARRPTGLTERFASAPSAVKNAASASERRRRVRPADRPARDDLRGGHEADQYRDAQGGARRPAERAQAAKHHQRQRAEKQRGEQPHPLEVVHAGGLAIGRLQQPAVDRPRVRGAELQHLAELLVRLAQVRVVVAQPVVMKGGRPVGEDREQEQKRRQQPRPHAGGGASAVASSEPERRWPERPASGIPIVPARSSSEGPTNAAMRYSTSRPRRGPGRPRP